MLLTILIILVLLALLGGGFGSTRGWGSAQPLPFFDEVEDKAA